MTAATNWQSLAEAVGCLRQDGELVSSDDARRALELLIGEDALRASVEHYLTGGPGSELARHVLWLLRPWSAMLRCYEIYRSERPLEERRLAVELLRVAADRRALPWVEEFLADDDAEVQVWGAGMVDQMLLAGVVEAEDVEGVVERMERHRSAGVRERALVIRECCSRREAYRGEGEA